VLALQESGLASPIDGDRLEAVAVCTGEGELGAGVGVLAAHDQARALRPAGEVDQVGRLGYLAVVAWRASWPNAKSSAYRECGQSPCTGSVRSKPIEKRMRPSRTPGRGFLMNDPG